MPRNPHNPKPGSKTVPTVTADDATPPVGTFVRERKPHGPRGPRGPRLMTVTTLDDGTDETPSHYPLWAKIVLGLIVGYVLADWWVRRSYALRVVPERDDRPSWREQLAERQRQEELRVVREERNSAALDRIAGALDAIVKDAK